MRGPIPLDERLASSFAVDPNTECWVWQKSLTTAGYGRVAIREDGRYIWWAAHRLVYEQLVGPIPDGLVIDHLCRNRACVNPEHLEPVTQRVNLLRGDTLQAANAAKTHCKFGHEFTPENTYRNERGRYCRACRVRRNRESLARKRAASGAA